MAGPEQVLQQAILVKWGKHPRLRLFRRNVGAMRDDSGRLVRFGIPGQSDLHGWLAPAGRAIELEIKTPSGRVSEPQQNWIDTALEFGVAAAVIRSMSEADAFFEELLGEQSHA